MSKTSKVDASYASYVKYCKRLQIEPATQLVWERIIGERGFVRPQNGFRFGGEAPEGVTLARVND